MKPKKDVAGFAGFTEILSVTIPWQEQLSIPKPLKHNSVLWGSIFAARNHLLGKLWSLLTVFHQSDLSPHAFNYSTPHKSTATTYSYILYIYRFIISPVFFQPVFFCVSFSQSRLEVEKNPWGSLGPVPRPNWAPAPGGSRSHILVLSHGHVFQKKKGEFCPILQHHSGFGAVFPLQQLLISYWWAVNKNVPAWDKTHS